MIATFALLKYVLMNDCRFVTLLLIVIEELFDVIFCFCLEFLIMLSNTDVGPADVQM